MPIQEVGPTKQCGDRDTFDKRHGMTCFDKKLVANPVWEAQEIGLLPEYLEADEVGAIVRAANDPRARLLTLEQWRAGLRVSEALALEVSNLSLDANSPTRKVRSGKRRRARVVPVHPELESAFRIELSYGKVSEGRLIDMHRVTAWRWVQTAVRRV